MFYVKTLPPLYSEGFKGADLLNDRLPGCQKPAVGSWLALAGLLLSFPLLIDLGIVFFGVSVLFYVITLLVEFSASARAIALLRENHVLNEEELNGVKKSMCVYFTNKIATAKSKKSKKERKKGDFLLKPSLPANLRFDSPLRLNILKYSTWVKKALTAVALTALMSFIRLISLSAR